MQHPIADVVRALLDARLPPDDARGALVEAVQMGDIEIVHMLVEAGTNVNGETGVGNALLAAIETRNSALMTYLEDHGAREKP